MTTVKISDITMRQSGKAVQYALSFSEKIELAKLLDRLNTDVIELDGIEQPKVDALRIKSIALAVEKSTLCVPVALNEAGVEAAWSAISTAKSPRLQVGVPVSPVQMEYMLHAKPAAVLALISRIVSACKARCKDVEFVAEDACRADFAFLCDALGTAIAAGATTVTLSDVAGNMLPNEFGAFINKVQSSVSALKTVTLGVHCANELAMADACAMAAIHSGATEIKAAAYRVNAVSLSNIVRLIAAKGEKFGVCTGINTTCLNSTAVKIEEICQRIQSEGSPFSNGVHDEENGFMLNASDSRTTVAKAIIQLGYHLSDDDEIKVYKEFMRIAAKKDGIAAKELDAIVAAVAMQVPQTYTLENYVVTTGSSISATAHLRIRCQNAIQEGVCIGDGPIDASFLAIEQITGHHYELDDFQIQAVTEGREAMGQTVVRLRHNGKLFSGSGISTDIVASGIGAYLSALNKIVFEEDDA